MMARSVLLIAVVLLVLALPAFAQPPAGGQAGGQAGGRGDRGGGMGMMSAPPVMTMAEGNLYVIFMGQLSMFNAKTLELVKTVPLPMPQPPMGGPGGPPAGGGPPPPPPG